MAFGQEITQRPISFGNHRMSWGTFDLDGVVTGELDTGLRQADVVFLQPNSDTAPTTECQVHETFPYDGSAITITGIQDVQGMWFAIGY